MVKVDNSRCAPILDILILTNSYKLWLYRKDKNMLNSFSNPMKHKKRNPGTSLVWETRTFLKDFFAKWNVPLNARVTGYSDLKFHNLSPFYIFSIDFGG